MTWNSTCPVGSISVKANRIKLQENITYIETNMGDSIVGTNTNITRDHFWNLAGNENGRHRFINSPAFTVATLPADPVIGSGMDAVLYLKTTNSRAEWFNRNNDGIYQVSPSFLSGTVAVPSGAIYSTVVAVPAEVYGEIFMYTTIQGRYSTVTGFFRSGAALVESWALTNHAQGSGDAKAALKFGNGSEATGLNIRARADDAAAGQNWNYRITYRAL